MIRTRVLGFVAVAVIAVLATTACRRIPEPQAGKMPPSQTIQVPADGKIPADWGRLVAVVDNPITTGVYTMWFEDADGNIRIVYYGVRFRQLNDTAELIERQ